MTLRAFLTLTMLKFLFSDAEVKVLSPLKTIFACFTPVDVEYNLNIAIPLELVIAVYCLLLKVILTVFDGIKSLFKFFKVTEYDKPHFAVRMFVETALAVKIVSILVITKL